MSTTFTAPLHPSSNNMTIVSDDPSWWPFINSSRIASYFAVAASAGVMYDWVLTLGQEVELIWRQRWSLMTILYLGLRYLGILYAVFNILLNVLTIPVTDTVSRIMYLTMNWAGVVAFAIICAIMTARLHAMYQQSIRLFIFLIVIFLAVNITNGIIFAIVMKGSLEEELILSGTYQCTGNGDIDISLLSSMNWMLATIWEVFALCLIVWIVIKHFRGLQRPWAAWITISDSVTVLMKTHILYFASFLAISCFRFVYLSPTISADQYSMGTQIYEGVLQIPMLVQSFVLGPRLILSVREHQAKLAAESDAGISMTSIVFQDRMHVSTGSGV
ncbi:uncharacterized protein HD556DRAFT_847995 [Suillus plorans]|uniref:DUF6533 domain-containing protein n=1 Tax=Suillus plorans TaxID=116603 RepID=A0A9P7AFY3_9AGAM|nr:uncharacterized protein HD556DRAFT_847995 [Suillus plorans]KAG1788655.1 hypothetical protein HD556DRAFT_847995 [Suillus plorans]